MMARHRRAHGRTRGARRAPRVGISSGGRRFDTPARTAFLHAANDNRPRGWARVWNIAVVVGCGLGVMLVGALVAL